MRGTRLFFSLLIILWADALVLGQPACEICTATYNQNGLKIECKHPPNNEWGSEQCTLTEKDNHTTCTSEVPPACLYTETSPPPPPPAEYTVCVTGNAECQDPLVLDLNGDGIHTTGTSELVWFDMDGDGKPEQTAWTDPATAEGFLYLDLDHKNRVTSGRELFGVGTVMPDGSRGHDGFAALAVYDLAAHGGNGDGILDANDAVWNRLRIWVDASHDGICDPNETGPIHKYGVEQIDIAAASMNAVDDSGNLHAMASTYRHRTKGDTIQAIGFLRAR